MSRSSYGQVRGPLVQHVEGLRGLMAHLSRWLAGGKAWTVTVDAGEG